MKTYWDFSEKERSELTQEQVSALLDVELMQHGVLKPVAPVLKPVPTNPAGAKKQFFTVNAKGKYGSNECLKVCFHDVESAQKFIELRPVLQDYDYEVGSDFEYAIPLSDANIETVELYDINQINAFRSELKRRKALSEENERLTSEFKKACDKSEKVTDGVWSNWYQCCAVKQKLEGIVSTFNDYTRLTEGDQNLALTFLKKLHAQEDIESAREWFPDQIISEPMAVCASAHVAG